MRTPFERFMSRVEKTETCWIWRGTNAGSNARYGTFSFGGTKVYAHRWIYEQLVGPIPEGMEIDHVRDRGCQSKLCVNPDHLEPVTHAENRKRGRLTTCRSGKHDLTDPANVLWDKDGNRRGCAQCPRDHARKRYHAKKELA